MTCTATNMIIICYTFYFSGTVLFRKWSQDLLTWKPNYLVGQSRLSPYLRYAVFIYCYTVSASFNSYKTISLLFKWKFSYTSNFFIITWIKFTFRDQRSKGKSVVEQHVEYTGPNEENQDKKTLNACVWLFVGEERRTKWTGDGRGKY